MEKIVQAFQEEESSEYFEENDEDEETKFEPKVQELPKNIEKNSENTKKENILKEMQESL